MKELGGRPFLTDCNTLYGAPQNALDHIEAAYENGFSPFSTGCQIIIADGLKGTDEVDALCAAANTSGRPISAAP